MPAAVWLTTASVPPPRKTWKPLSEPSGSLAARQATVRWFGVTTSQPAPASSGRSALTSAAVIETDGDGLAGVDAGVGHAGRAGRGHDGLRRGDRGGGGREQG